MAEVSLSQPMSIAEKIPEVAKFDKLTAGSVIRGRRVVRYIPSTGQSVSSSSGSAITTFRISDSNAYLDPQSCYLTFIAAIPQFTAAADLSGTAGGILPDDTAISFFQRVRSEMNSVQMDDIQNVNSLAHSLVYLLGDKQAYCQDLGLLAGSWKFNDFQFGSSEQTNATSTSGSVAAAFDSEGSFAAVQRRGQVAWRLLYTAAGAATTNSTYYLQYAIPLSYFGFGLFRQQQLIPLRNMGVLTLNFYTAQAAQALRGGCARDAITGGTLGLDGAITYSPSFTLSQLSIVGAVCDMASDYTELVDRIATTSETGITMGFDSFTNVQSGYGAVASTSPADRSITFSRATTSLRNMYLVRQPSAWANNLGKCSVTGFPWMNCIGFRVQVNSQYFPESGSIDNPVEQYAFARQGHGLLGNQNAIGNTRVEGWTTTASANSDVNGQHILACSFDRVTSEYLSLDGLSTISSGGTITVYLKDGGSVDAAGVGNPITVNAWLEATRFLVLRMNQVSVVG